MFINSNCNVIEEICDTAYTFKGNKEKIRVPNKLSLLEKIYKKIR